MTTSTAITVTPITVNDLTTVEITGTGVFDVLMRANKQHLEQEFEKNRIRGPEYSQVYLGSLTQVLQTALAFLLANQKAALEAQLIAKQIELAQSQIDKTVADKDYVAAQTALVVQQRTNLVAEALNIPKQGQLIDANKAQVTQQTANLVSQKLQIETQTELTAQQKINAITENTVLIAQECKLRAEFDLIMANVLKSAQETSLLTQKVATERAQVTALGVDDNSVVGKQKLLYQAQTDGFKRDAEQKAAKLMVDTWNVRRTTDEGTVADSVNSLNDAAVGRAVTKLLAGVQA